MKDARLTDVHARIDALRTALGSDLVIMGHHYQSDDIMRHVDRAGDSLQLSQMMEDIAARHIVFCGVHFMAESACLLAREGQNVHLPVSGAGCVMANMTPAALLDAVLKRLAGMGRKIVPLAYVNTSLAVKAVVGAHGGAVCTSSNARAMLKWAMEQADAVLFLPDKNLGGNTADQLGVPLERRHVLNVRQGGQLLDGDAVARASLLFWPGCCAIHHLLHPAHVIAMRAAYPEAKIYVHPECAPETVRLCDGAGSTSFLIKTADAAPDGATLVIGTEVNLVDRLARRQKGRVNILPLARVACSNMAKTTPERLLAALESIADGSAVPVQTDSSLFADGRASLTRMLAQG